VSDDHGKEEKFTISNREMVLFYDSYIPKEWTLFINNNGSGNIDPSITISQQNINTTKTKVKPMGRDSCPIVYFMNDGQVLYTLKQQDITYINLLTSLVMFQSNVSE